MIRFERAPEPEEFDTQVRQPGRVWLENHPLGQRPPEYWAPFKPQLAEGFRSLCGYSVLYEPIGTVDHYLSLDQDRSSDGHRFQDGHAQAFVMRGVDRRQSPGHGRLRARPERAGRSQVSRLGGPGSISPRPPRSRKPALRHPDVPPAPRVGRVLRPGVRTAPSLSGCPGPDCGVRPPADRMPSPSGREAP